MIALATSKYIKKLFCDQKSTGGWLGFTDKYWMATLIPDQNEPINANFRHGNNGRDNFRVGYVGKIFNINSKSDQYLQGSSYLQEQKILNILTKLQKSVVYQNSLMLLTGVGSVF